MDKKWATLLGLGRIRVLCHNKDIMEIELWENFSDNSLTKEHKEKEISKLKTFASSWKSFTHGKITIRGSARLGKQNQHIGFRINRKENYKKNKTLEIFINTVIKNKENINE